MKIKNLLLLGICAATIVGSNAQTSQNKVLDAVMRAYEEELQKTPNDFNLLYSRANQYFLNGNYEKALKDINNALKYTTRDDSEILHDEYILRATIYEMKKEYSNAANDATEALRLIPSSATARYINARCNYELGNYTVAKADYQALLRLNSLDYDAYFGQAKIAVKEQNKGQAKELVNKCVDLYPAQAAVYVNRAEIMSMLGEDNAAAHDLLNAISLDYEKSGALQKLVDMSKSNYSVVIDALNDAIGKAPNSGTMIYIRSLIALNNGNFALAEIDLNTMIANKLYMNAGIYFDHATALYNLGRYQQALGEIIEAITIDPNVGMYYVLRSQILMALNKKGEALQTINSTLLVEPDDIEALIQKAEILLADNKYKDALTVLNNVIMVNPEYYYAYLVRANIKTNLKDKKGAQNDYRQLLTIGDDNIKSYKGFALCGLGRNVEAKQWLDNLFMKSQNGGGEMFYLAASLYGQCGDLQKALDYFEGALANGYGSYHRIMNSDIAKVDLSLIKNNPRFKALMTQYKSNF
ncbi:MAG: tetratricopeptide repeat protein [Muribaculaceae bacterium]|nr:tetratricopeptide repeat protein [Muribaculaceae bacterium]